MFILLILYNILNINMLYKYSVSMLMLNVGFGNGFPKIC